MTWGLALSRRVYVSMYECICKKVTWDWERPGADVTSEKILRRCPQHCCFNVTWMPEKFYKTGEKSYVSFLSIRYSSNVMQQGFVTIHLAFRLFFLTFTFAEQLVSCSLSANRQPCIPFCHKECLTESNKSFTEYNQKNKVIALNFWVHFERRVPHVCQMRVREKECMWGRDVRRWRETVHVSVLSFSALILLLSTFACGQVCSCHGSPRNKGTDRRGVPVEWGLWWVLKSPLSLRTTQLM